MRKKQIEKEDKARSGSGDFSGAIVQICEEKGISKEKVIETIEAALAAAYKKDYGERGQNIKAFFDEVSGKTKFFLIKEVVDETTRIFSSEEEEEEKKEDWAKDKKKKERRKKSDSILEEEKLPRFNPERDFTVEEAQEMKKGAKVGDVIEIELEQKEDYGRVAAQTAKQVIIQRIREAEREAMYEEYKNKEGEVVSGLVQRIEGRNVFVDLGKSIGILFPQEQIEKENYRLGQRLRVLIQKVDIGSKGPGIILSRSNPEVIKKLFELEVPEIFSGTVQIKAVAREAGERAKVAVSSSEDGIDPIGSCVGQKGTRVQAIIDELCGEKIDIIAWNENPVKFISASLSPAKILRVDIDEEKKQAVAVVPDDQLSLAIGKKGQNVRLAAKLTNWRIDISGVSDNEKEEEKESEKDAAKKEDEIKDEKEDKIKDEKAKTQKEPKKKN